MRKGLIIFSINLFLFCSGEKITYEERLIRNTVSRYNSAIIETYKDFDLTRLEDCATEGEIKRIDVLILTIRMEGKLLNAKLKRLKFKNTRKINEEKAEVDTEEEWEYQHLNIKNRQPVDELKRVKYNMTYTLVKKDGKWLVKFVDYTETKGERRDLLEEYQEFIKKREKEKEVK